MKDSYTEIRRGCTELHRERQSHPNPPRERGGRKRAVQIFTDYWIEMNFAVSCNKDRTGIFGSWLTVLGSRFSVHDKFCLLTSVF
ncbi:MAG: hypothetical protein V1779_12120 [bacterium]